MATESAIPEHLFRYSDICTQGAKEFQSWVRTVLTSAVRDYQVGGGVCTAIDGEVARQVAAAYYTDRDVRVVGQAFLQAGGTTVRNSSMPIMVPEAKLSAVFQKLQHQAQINAGAALTRGLPNVMNPDERRRIERELAKHADDPYFCAGFFNSLNLRQIEQFLAKSTNIRPFVNACASGVLSEETTTNFVETLSRLAGRDYSFDDNHIAPEQQIALLDSLARTPAAAINFARLLNAAQLRHLFYGEASLNPPLRNTLLGVLTSGLSQELEPAVAQALLHKVSVGLFGKGTYPMSRHEWVGLLPSLKQLYSTGVAMMSSGAIPGEGPSDWLKWFGGKGKAIGDELAPFLHAANSASPNHELLKSMLDGGWVNVLSLVAAPLTPGLLPAKIAFTAGVGMAESWYLLLPKADPVHTKIPELFSDSDSSSAVFHQGQAPDASKLNACVITGAFSVMVGSLIAQKRVHSKWNSTPVLFGKDPAANLRILQGVLNDPTSYKVGSRRDGDDPPTIHYLYTTFRLGEQHWSDGLESGYSQPKE